MTDTNDDQVLLAKLAYAAYGHSTGFTNFQGNAMPGWDDLGDTIQQAWMAAADAVADYLEQDDPDMTEIFDRHAVGEN